MAAASRIINDEEKLALALKIKQQHAQIAQLTDEIELNKQALSLYSQDLFLADAGKEIPEVNGNHDYHTTEGTLTVNFKITGKLLNKVTREPLIVNDRPAAELLREKFGAETDKLFSIDSDVKVISEESTRRSQIVEHPELFQIALNSLTHEQMTRLMIEHPDYVTVLVPDPKAYGTVYPACVQKGLPVASFKAGFLEKYGKLSDVVRKKAGGLVRALLPGVIQATVNCGPTSKKG
jgi:hypothetical protein